jgi:hypothetical protein
MGHGDDDFRLVAQKVEDHAGFLGRNGRSADCAGVLRDLASEGRGNLAPATTLSKKKRLRGLRFC